MQQRIIQLNVAVTVRKKTKIQQWLAVNIRECEYEAFLSFLNLTGCYYWCGVASVDAVTYRGASWWVASFIDLVCY